MFVFWQTKGPQVIAAIQDAILTIASQVLNGRLAADRLDISMSGTTIAHKLVVYDSQEAGGRSFCFLSVARRCSHSLTTLDSAGGNQARHQ